MAKYEKIMIPLLIAYYNIEDEYVYSLDHTFIDQFEFILNKNVTVKMLTDDLLSELSCIPHHIFTDSFYFTHSYQNNPIREQIEAYLLSHPIPSSISFSFQSVLSNIDQDYRLLPYCSNETLSDPSQLKSLLFKNTKAIVFVPKKQITHSLLIDLLKINNYVSLVLDGIEHQEEFEKSDLFLHRDEYKKNDQIKYLMTQGLKEYIGINPYHFIHLSKESRNQIELAEYVLSIDSRYLAYCGPNIYKDKKIMLEMINKDKGNIAYLDDSLKKDNDFILYIN